MGGNLSAEISKEMAVVVIAEKFQPKIRPTSTDYYETANERNQTYQQLIMLLLIIIKRNSRFRKFDFVSCLKLWVARKFKRGWFFRYNTENMRARGECSFPNYSIAWNYKIL